MTEANVQLANLMAVVEQLLPAEQVVFHQVCRVLRAVLRGAPDRDIANLALMVVTLEVSVEIEGRIR